MMDEEHWTGVCSIESDFSAFITQFAGVICLLLKLSAFSIFLFYIIPLNGDQNYIFTMLNVSYKFSNDVS